MINYDKRFEGGIDRDFFYNLPGYNGRKLIVGRISLDKAKARIG